MASRALPAAPAKSTPATNTKAAVTPTRPMASPTGRAAEAGRERTLRKDRSNFHDLQERAGKRIEAGPFRLRPPVKIATKTIDTDTIGRVNKANQKMSQFLYNLANEPSIGLYHVNDHVRRTVPRLVTVRKDIDHQKVEMDKSSCDVDEILPTVRIISELESFKSIKSILTRSIQLASPKPPGSRSLGPPTPTRTPASTSPNASMRNIDTSQIAAQAESSRVPLSTTSNEPLNDHKSTNTHSATHSTPEEPDESTVEPTRSRSTEVETVSDSISTADQSSKSTEILVTIESSTASESVLEPAHSEQESFSLAVAESSLHPHDVPDATSSESVVEPIETSDEPKMSHEEMILGARAHSSKKKKGGAKGKSDNLVPKNF